jgi:hypothetical protein
MITMMKMFTMSRTLLQLMHQYPKSIVLGFTLGAIGYNKCIMTFIHHQSFLQSGFMP